MCKINAFSILGYRLINNYIKDNKINCQMLCRELPITPRHWLKINSSVLISFKKNSLSCLTDQQVNFYQLITMTYSWTIRNTLWLVLILINDTSHSIYNIHLYSNNKISQLHLTTTNLWSHSINSWDKREMLLQSFYIIGQF